MPLTWSAGKAAQHIFHELRNRPLEIALPGMFMATLWPLSKTPDRTKLAIGKRMVRSSPPIMDQL